MCLDHETFGRSRNQDFFWSSLSVIFLKTETKVQLVIMREKFSVGRSEKLKISFVDQADLAVVALVFSSITQEAETGK